MVNLIIQANLNAPACHRAGVNIANFLVNIGAGMCVTMYLGGACYYVGPISFRMMIVAAILNIIKSFYNGRVKMEKKWEPLNKPMCGLWHANVAVSEHNDNGACECLNCFGTHCHDCATFEKLADERAGLDLLQKTRCQLCQAYEYKTR